MVQMINAQTPIETARAELSGAYDLKFSPAIKKETDPIYQTVKDRIPEVEWPFFAPLIFAINRLKKEKGRGHPRP